MTTVVDRYKEEIKHLNDEIENLKHIIHTRATPSDDTIAGLEIVGYLWECAQYKTEDKGYYGYETIITESTPIEHVSPIEKTRNIRPLVLHSEAAVLIAAKTKEIESLNKFLSNALAYGAILVARAEAAEAELAQIRAQEPVAWQWQSSSGDWIDCDELEAIRKVGIGKHNVRHLYASPVYDSLKAENERLREALMPFAATAELDIGEDEADEDYFKIMQKYNYAKRLTVGDMRKALSAIKGDSNDKA